MNGWLVINSFAQTEGSLKQFGLLKKAAEDKGIGLRTVRTVEVSSPVNPTLGQSLAPFNPHESDRINSSSPRPDFILFWDKDVLLAQVLESRGFRLFNTAKAIETCDSKALSTIALNERGIPMPKTFISPKTFEYFGYNDLSFLSVYEEAFGYPYVIKEEFGSFGLGVYLVRNRLEAEEQVKKLGFKTFIAQEYIQESSGRDLRLYVVGGQVRASMLRENRDDFRSNIFQGGTGTAYTPSPEEEALAIKAAEAAGCDFCGVDLLIGGNEPLVCEVNSNAHFTGLLSCTGVNMADQILDHIISTITSSASSSSE